nr:phenylalanine--tRNA ligase subunit beta [Micromonospora sp. DSM 115978]
MVRRRLADVGCAIADLDAFTDVDQAARADGTGSVTDHAGVVVVTPPSWRPDLTRPADLVEEVVRLEGYDTIPVRLPELPAGRGLTQPQRLRRSVGRALAYDGLTEVLTVPFAAAEVVDQLGLPEDDRRRALVKVANPIAEDAAYLRSSLLPGLIAAALRN